MHLDIATILLIFSSVLAICLLIMRRKSIKPIWVCPNLIIFLGLFALVLTFYEYKYESSHDALKSSYLSVAISLSILGFFVFKIRSTIRHPALFLLPLAIFSNSFVTYQNDGFMPADRDKYLSIQIAKGHSEEKVEESIKNLGNYKWIDKKTRFTFLSDRIVIPGLGRVYSLGDILVMSMPIVTLMQYSRRKYKKISHR